MFCSTRSLICEHRSGGVAVPLRCRSWNCDECAQERKTRLIATAIAGEPNRFITLTSRRSPGASAITSARQLAHAWRLVIKRWRRKYPSRQCDYLAIFEATKAGWPHLHILWRGGWISQKWLSSIMTELASSPVCDVRKISSGQHAARYVAKYCGKAPGKFGQLKRYWQTPSYRLLKHIAALKDRPKRGPWIISAETVNTIFIIWQSYGRDVQVHHDWSISWGQPPPEPGTPAGRVLYNRLIEYKRGGGA